MDLRLDLLKNYFMAIKAQNIEWNNLYPLNIEALGKEGIYTYHNFPMEDSWKLVKYTISYQYARNKEFNYIDEDTKYYVLFKDTISDLNCRIKFSEPSKENPLENVEVENKLGRLLDNYGQFLGVFKDEKTAKAATLKSMLGEIKEYSFTLPKEQRREWFEYTKDYSKVGY